MKNALPADTAATLTFGHTEIGTAEYDQGNLIRVGPASALATRSMAGLLQSANSSIIYEWGEAVEGSGHVTRYDPLVQRRRDTLVLKNLTPRTASIDDSANRIVLVQENRVTVVAIDLGSFQESDRRFLEPLPGPIVGRFSDASSQSIWLICRVDSDRKLVEISTDTLDYGRTLALPAEIEHIGPGVPGTHYFATEDRLHVFDSDLGDFVADYPLDLGGSIIANAIHITQLSQLVISSSGVEPRLRTFDAETLEPGLNIPVPVPFHGSMFYREQDGLLYGASSGIPTTIVAVDPASGEIVDEKITGYDLIKSSGSLGFLYDVVYDSNLDMATYVTSEQAMGSFPGGSLDMTPARPIREGVREMLTDPARNRIWMIGTAGPFVDWIEYYHADTMEVLGSIQRSTTQGTIVSQRIDESTGDLQLEVRTDPRTVIHINRESMAIEERANLDYTATSTSTRAVLAVASTGELYAYVPTTPPQMLRFPVGSSIHDATYTFPEDASVSFLGHDDVLNVVFGLGADPEGQKIFHFAPTDLSLLDALGLDGTVSPGPAGHIIYHRQRREIVVWGGLQCAAVPIENPEIRIIRIAPSDGFYVARMMEYDDVTAEIHVVFSHGSTVEWHTLDAESGRLRTHGLSHGEGFFFPHVIRQGPEPVAVANISGVLKRLERNNPTLRPFDHPPSRVLALGQSFGPVGDSQVLISREHSQYTYARRLLSPSFIETADWKSHKVIDRPVGIITGKTADMVGLPTTPPTIAVLAAAQFPELSIIDAESMEELDWTGLDPEFGESVWMEHEPVGNHLVVATLLEDGGGYLLTLDADSLDLIAEHEFSLEEGTPLVGALDPMTGDIVVGLDGAAPSVVRFSVPALTASGDVSLLGHGLPTRGGMAIDGDSRRVFSVLRESGRRVSIDLESFEIQDSVIEPLNLPPNNFTYELLLHPQSGLGYAVGRDQYAQWSEAGLRVHEFRLDDCQRTRTIQTENPPIDFLAGRFSLDYDFETDLLVIGGSYYVHTTFRDMFNKTLIQIQQKVSADAIRFYSHVADGDLNLGIYAPGTYSSTNTLRERVWESGSFPNTVENDFVTIPVQSPEGDPIFLEPGYYYLTWRTNSSLPVGSLTYGVSGATAWSYPFEADAARMPHRPPNLTVPSFGPFGAWTFYLEATVIEEPLTGWAIH